MKDIFSASTNDSICGYFTDNIYHIANIDSAYRGPKLQLCCEGKQDSGRTKEIDFERVN